MQTRSNARSGFSLLEILIAVAVMAMLAGAAIPVASKALSSAARKATREELVQIGLAAQEYFRDTEASPEEILDLERASDAAGWAGPYLAGAMQDPLATSSGYTTDAWSRDYRVKAKGDALTVASSGADATFGTDDDVEIRVDFTPIRRERTLEELKTINQAITLYNGVHGADKPLSTTWKTSLGTLVDAGFLPEEAAYLKDAWGEAYRAEPEGKSPLVKVASDKVEGTSSKESGKDGADKDKDKDKDKKEKEKNEPKGQSKKDEASNGGKSDAKAASKPDGKKKD